MSPPAPPLSPGETWGWLPCQCGEPAWNMGVDELLLHRARHVGRPVLRFYGWSAPAATFGYFQRYAEAAAVTALRPLVRRPTGGGLVPHDGDWTYSIAVPPGHAWSALAARDSYYWIHEWLRQAFARLGLETELAPSARKDMPGQCFAGAEQHDLLWKGLKVAGAAQRRNREGLLIQGSVQGITTRSARAPWEEAMRAVFQEGWRVRWEEQPLDFREEAERLARERYASESWNRRR